VGHVDERHRDREDGVVQREVRGERPLEQRGARRHHPPHAAGDVGELADEDLQDLEERERGECEVKPREPDGGQADGGATRSRGERAHEEREPEGPASVRVEQRGRVRADRHERRVTHGDLAGVAGQEVQSHSDDDVHQHEVDEVELVRPEEPRSGGEHEHGRGEHERARHQTRRACFAPKSP
jgi:hypothetical protein